MELLTDGTEKNAILGFCLNAISRYVETWPPAEEDLAQEFVAWMGFNSFLTRDALTELCRAKGVNLSFTPLPQELRGFNCTYQDKKEIVLTERETAPFSDSHTLFHEFREMLEHVFTELGYPIIGPEHSLEMQAELFAVACRMKAAEREFPAFIEMAHNVEKTWVRYLAYTLVAVFGVVYFLSCFLTPQMEEILSEARR
jgi:hypothetical protein